MSVKRNGVCSCGSGKKHKKCCLLKSKSTTISTIVNINSMRKLVVSRVVGQVRYVFTGHVTKNGQRYMADADCSCGGRGYSGEDIKKHVLIPCKCLVTISLPMDWLIVPKKFIHKGKNGI